MTKVEFEAWRARYLANPKIKRGLDLFEAYIGRIEWMHPKAGNGKVARRKIYRVINKLGEVVFESDNITNIAKELCLSKSRVSNSINSLTLLKGEYLVERCGDE
jgi:hypothetical protein